MINSSKRRVTANMSLTLDGRYSGPGGASDLGAIVPYAVTDVARDHLTRIWETATTAVLGRRNAEGFLGYWPSIASNEAADPRDRAYARWLVEAEKVVFSTTLSESPWERTRLVNAVPVDVVTELRSAGEGDILVNSSASIIKALLSADMIDRLYLMICPQICGGGQRLFDDGLPGTKWTLAHREIGKLGEIALTYERTR
jgi:dihydrofolate reductase